MTIPASAWAPARPEALRLTTIDLMAFGLGVLAMLIFSQGWVLPLMGEKADPAASGLLRAMFFPAYAAGLVLVLLNPWETIFTALRQPLLILLIGVVCASVLWSVAPDQTVRRAIAIGFTTLCGLALAARFTWWTLAEVVASAFAVLAVLSLLVCLFVPSIGRMHELFPGAWRGLWMEKNALGGNMALAFCILSAAALLNPRRAIIWWPMAGLAILLVLASTSKTSLLSLMLGAAAVGFIAIIRRGPVLGVVATYLAVVGGALIACVFIFDSTAVFALLGKDATLTGRTKIWAAVIRQIKERPWLGWGYGAVWDEPEHGWGPLPWIIKDAGFRPQHAHNAWLEQWLSMGVVGLGAWILYYLETMTRALIAVFRESGAYLAFPYLLVYSLTTLTESVAVTYNDMRWVMFVAFAAKLVIGDRPGQR